MRLCISPSPLKVAHVTIKYCNHIQFYVGLCIFIDSVLDTYVDS